MPRLRARDAALRLSEPHYEALLHHRGRTPPPGYTLNTLVTEWLTLNSVGDWYSLSISGRGVQVRWFARADYERARAHFGPNGPWRAARSRALEGFESPPT